MRARFGDGRSRDLNVDVETSLYHSKSFSVPGATFRNRAAIVNIRVSVLKSFIRDHIRHEHSAPERDGVGTRWNADDSEFAAHPIVMYAAGISLTGNEMQFPAVVAHDPIPHRHVAIMLRRGASVTGENVWSAAGLRIFRNPDCSS
jgi:hypothetical protein